MVTKVTYCGLTRDTSCMRMWERARRGGYGWSRSSRCISYDVAQPYRRPLFVVRATDPAIDGSGDPMAP